ncbi:MAG: RodZ domain-containing protein [Solirubrobacteraceae bacterium]
MAEIGARLREARMRAKVDINEVELRTKIRAKYLRAMENEEWDLLPGEVYAKSFLRTYGDYLGLDSRQLIDDFKSRYERPTDHELRPIAPLGRERERARRGPLVPPWAIIGVVLVAVVAVLWVVGNLSNQKAATTPTHASVTRHHARSRHHRGRTHAAARPSAVKLELVPTGQVWVCVISGTGKKLIPGQIYDTGQTIPVQTAPKLLITLGNASVKMKINGATVPVPPSSSSVGYELLPGSHRLLPASQQPRCA